MVLLKFCNKMNEEMCVVIRLCVEQWKINCSFRVDADIVATFHADKLWGLVYTFSISVFCACKRI